MRAALLLLLLTPAFAQQGPCTVEGTVTRAGDGAPVPHARIFFRTTSTQQALVLGYFSGDDGRFTATGLNPATYSLSVQKRGLLAAPKSPTSINLSRDCHARGLALSLSPAATLSGRVTAPAGLGSGGVRVEAQRRAWFNGRWQYRATASVNANALGEFRIANLPAGGYILRAYPAGPQSVSFRNLGGPEQSISPSYFPGVLSSTQARPVAVEAGAEAAGLDFPLLLTPLVRVAGRIVSSEGLKAPAWCSVSLRSSPPGSSFDARYQASDGSFVFPEVPPGDYDLLAYSAESASVGSASRRIRVDANDLDGLDVALDPPFTLQARATLQGGTLPASGLHVRLHPLTLRGVEEEPVPVAADGAVEFNAFLRDRYRVEFTSTQPDIYLKSILVAGRALPSTVLDITDPSSARELMLLLANDGGRVEGVATGFATASLGFAVLVPADLSQLSSATLRTAQISIDGRFRLASVPPGDYLVYAFSQSLGGAFQLEPMLQDPGWVPTFKGPATTLRVEPNSLAKVQLSVQPPP
jgi:hypothetical protein